MNATTTITIRPTEAVPREGRAAWLEQHGVPPQSAEVRVTATYAAWDGLGELREDGTVCRLTYHYSDCGRAVRDAICRQITETGSVPEEVEVTDLLLDLAETLRQKEEQAAAERAERKAREAAERAEREAAKQAEQAEKEAWIAAHGSGRLRALVAEGIECEAVYRDERLSHERPGWRYLGDVRGYYSEPRNAPVKALDLLDEARTTAPDAVLLYWEAEEEYAEDSYGDDPERPAWRGYVAKAELCGRSIVLGGPTD